MNWYTDPRAAGNRPQITATELHEQRQRDHVDHLIQRVIAATGGTTEQAQTAIIDALRQHAEDAAPARVQAANARNARRSPGFRAVLAFYAARPVATTAAFRDAIAAGDPRGSAPEALLGTRQEGHEWYRIVNSTATGTARVDLLDEVGAWGVRAADFIRDLNAIHTPELEVHVNSPGGEVFDGLAVHNALRSHPARVTVIVDGLAASIASVIAMAGDRIVMAPHSQMMVHSAAGVCVGNEQEMLDAARLMARQDRNIAAVYAERAGGSVDDWLAVMRAETWYSDEEAVAAGLADEIA